MRTATRRPLTAALAVAASVCLAAGPACAITAEAGPAHAITAGTGPAHAITAEAGPVAAAVAEGDPPDTSLDLYPATVTPGDKVTVHTLACGVRSRASGDASAVGAGMFKLAVGTHDEVVVGRFKVPASASPGTYSIRARCADGREVAGDLMVSLTAPSEPVNPKGHVKTGVGGALGPDPVQTAAGVAALAVAAAGGTWLLHRRARGDGI
ncbi:hypothetical protein [Streptomyces luteolus]|uniref:Sortase n=1 Tax=Streptomyces luteolus TaxID=3043615 RepID=A0ABT6SZT8_9ACTN|nr:hypothetical protein [Streptomyces sp. B-S-A12]MDI3421127.1 hypothetical protein [Streptomyces sp. B-S-A12]